MPCVDRSKMRTDFSPICVTDENYTDFFRVLVCVVLVLKFKILFKCVNKKKKKIKTYVFHVTRKIVFN